MYWTQSKLPYIVIHKSHIETFWGPKNSIVRVSKEPVRLDLKVSQPVAKGEFVAKVSFGGIVVEGDGLGTAFRYVSCGLLGGERDERKSETAE